ncbi:L-fucose isomerase [Tritrichomonas foetus]|uniref:L-fucose isomerase n=1 Tax=Tritrichomonas foetus TaxID=1144522 RepID=A0A1J4KUX7_9EUKA|nr:l-fucose isomerase [Tritrichomonas foetus]OHT14930.1 L-fucose isomerase [Tritrichomonas foetus]|eukprot:OHT14930.1 L-fucose isomerase [Tritrichomonas foetus]
MAADLLHDNLYYPDGEHCEVVISDCTIAGSQESYLCTQKFQENNVVATLTVTPCWCYGLETMDLDPHTIKAVWGFNGTERPGAVYLAAVMAAYGQRGLPAFSIYGHDVQDMSDDFIPEDVKEKILRFGRCAMAVGAMKNRCYLNIGGVCMGIAGSCVDPAFMQRYLGIRTEWVDMSEVHRRITEGIYDKEEYEVARKWVRDHCPEGVDLNKTDAIHAEAYTDEVKEQKWDFIVKMTLVIMDLFQTNPRIAQMGYVEESLGHNAIMAGFQGQRNWTDWLPNGDFTEAILNSTFNWRGKKQPMVLATENDTLNATAMLFGNLITHGAAVFCDVRTYWSPAAVERVTGWKPTGKAANGFIHLINSGAAALDGAGCAVDEKGNHVMKPWWEVTPADIEATLKATDWPCANRDYFRGGGYSSHFKTDAEMPITMIRVNIIQGLGPVLQLAEGWTVTLPENVHKTIDVRTDQTWPTTWFAPRLTGKGPFADVYSTMANWGANHCGFVYGHVGADLITLCSMLRIPVNMHNVEDAQIFRPHCWAAFGTKDLESADYRACQSFGPLYK